METKNAPRRSYLRHLLREFDEPATSTESKLQVLANLSNFAYDPANFEHIIELGVLDAFLEELSKPDQTELTLFACSGICNLSLDPNCAAYIIQRGGVPLLEKLVSSQDQEISLNAITSLYYLSGRHNEIKLNVDVAQFMLRSERSSDARLRNLATIFVEEVLDPGLREDLRKN